MDGAGGDEDRSWSWPSASPSTARTALPGAGLESTVDNSRMLVVRLTHSVCPCFSVTPPDYADDAASFGQKLAR